MVGVACLFEALCVRAVDASFFRHACDAVFDNGTMKPFDF
jgi:hypothetical protein